MKRKTKTKKQNLKSRNYCVTFRPQFGAPKMLRPGADVTPSPLSYATAEYCLHIFLYFGSEWRTMAQWPPPSVR